MKYFVTGGAGFIGSHLVDRLVKTGEVTVYDNFSSGKREFIQRHLSNPKFKLIEDDLLNFERLTASLKNQDVVFHLAANPEARLGIQNTRLDLEQETLATYNLLEGMRRNGVRKIVLASSGTIYGDTPVIPLPENYGPALPISLYGAGKLASEGLVSAFCGTFDFQGWIFRFSNVVGQPATHGAIYDFIHKLLADSTQLEILGNGKQAKPYLHVSDCVAGILFGFENSHEPVNLFNLGTESHTSVAAIARLVAEEMGLENVKVNFTGGERGWPGDVPQVRFNIGKIKKLGWSPRLDSDSAVRQSVKEVVRQLAAGESLCRR